MFVSDKTISPDLMPALPQGLVFVEQYAPGDTETLYPEESAQIASAVQRRRMEFAAGRSCAKKALSILGISNFPILSTASRAPIWPTGVIGSITHTEGYCAAVAGRINDYVSVGIDAEVVGRIGKELWPLLFTEEEHFFLANTPEGDQDVLATVFFGAKEAFFKCQYPITHKWLEFLDATVTVENRSFSVKTKVESSLSNGYGRFFHRKDDNLLITLLTA